jgi:hypothetical protein
MLRETGLWPRPITPWDELKHVSRAGGEPIVQQFGDAKALPMYMVRTDPTIVPKWQAKMEDDLREALEKNTDMVVLKVIDLKTAVLDPGSDHRDPLAATYTVMVKGHALVML